MREESASEQTHGVGGLVAGSAVVAGDAFVRSAIDRNLSSWDPDTTSADQGSSSSTGMNYRILGKSELKVSEVALGAWGIGGSAYGAADRAESRNALARAEELGCNLVNTAMVYGESEVVIGELTLSQLSCRLRCGLSCFLTSSDNGRNAEN